MSFRRVIVWGGGYPFAIGSVLLASAVFLPLRPLLPPTGVMLLYVPVIIGVAIGSGASQSATAAIAAFVALDLLFVPPYYRLTVASLPEWLGLVVFLIVALVSGLQTARLRERERAALQRQRELELLNHLSFRVASEKSPRATAEYIVSQICEVMGLARASLYEGASAAATPAILAETGEPKAASGEAALATWALKSSKAVALPHPEEAPYEQRLVSVAADEAIPGVVADGAYLPLQTASSLEGVLVAIPAPDRPLTADDGRLLAAVANLAASSLERQRLEVDAAHAEALREADRLKSTLVSSVSHELKTPLAAATARVTGLLDEGESADPVRIRAELAEVADDLIRLNSSIGDLLDLSRLESDAWQPHLEEYEVREILGTVLSRLPAAHRERIAFSLADDLPLVRVDFAQIARAITHLVENALTYSPVDSRVIVGASAKRRRVTIWVEDRGPGVSAGEKARVFDKFYRGDASASAPAGTGLGLAIAREIVLSHGGEIEVEDATPHGARFVMVLDAAAEEVR